MGRLRRSLVALSMLLTAALSAAAEVAPPTALGFSDPELYTVRAVRTSAVGVAPAWVEVEMGALRPLSATATGLQQAVVEVYLDDGGLGIAELLPGSGVRMPNGRGWRDAVRLSADGVQWWRSVPPIEEGGNPTLLGPSTLPFSRTGAVVRFTLPHPLSEGTRIVAISGVHHPFSTDGWRPFSATPNPWSFTGDPALAPVVGLYPGGDEALKALQRTGVLQSRMVPALLRWRSPAWGVLFVALGLGVFSAATLLRWWRSRRWWSESAPLEAP